MFDKHFLIFAKAVLLFVLLLFSLHTVAQNYRIDSLNALLKVPDQADSMKLEVLNDLAWEWHRVNPDSAIDFGVMMLKLANELNEKRNQARAMRKIGKAFVVKGVGGLDSAHYYFRKGLVIRQELNDPEALAIGLADMAGLFLSAAQYDSSLYYYRDALSIHENLRDSSRMANVINNIGAAYYYQGNIDQAIDHYYQSMKIDDAMGNWEKALSTLFNIGMLYFRMGQLDEADSFFRKSVSDPRLDTSSLDYLNKRKSIAIVQSEKGNLGVALAEFTSILKGYERIDFKPGIVKILVDRGVVYNRMEDTVNAIKDFELSLQIAEANGIPVSPLTLANLGSAFGKQAKHQDAINVSLKALEMGEASTSIKSFLASELATLNLSMTYEKLGKPKLALDYLHKHMVFSDLIKNEENKNQLFKQGYQYMVEKSQAESMITLQLGQTISNVQANLTQQIKIQKVTIGSGGIILLSLFTGFFLYKRKRDAEQRQKEAILNLQVSETEMKALRSQMNPHFIFNALQSIQTFLLTNREEDANEYLLKFSKLMRLVLENSQYNTVTLKEDIEALKLYMDLESIRLTHPFTYDISIDEELDEDDVSIPPLILQPFVENAIWHGLQHKDKPGHIQIDIIEQDGTLVVAVEDNGVGRKSSMELKNPIPMKRESLGMRLTEERLKIWSEQNKRQADFRVTDLYSNDQQPIGTRVELSLPSAA